MTSAEVPPRWLLTLYVNGASPRSTEAVETVRRVCDDHLAGQFDLTVVNAADQPTEVAREHILALPTLVKHSPPPRRYVVGHLTDLARVRQALDLDPYDGGERP